MRFSDASNAKSRLFAACNLDFIRQVSAKTSFLWNSTLKRSFFMQKFSVNFNRIMFSERFRNSSHAKKIAAIAVFAALSVVTNMLLEIRIFDVQFSLTIFVSAVTGVFLGPLAGFFACVFGDFVGYVFNSWGQLYMPWVGVSTGLFALIAGLVFASDFECGATVSYGKLYLKIAVYAAVTFVLCTAMINSVGFYLYNKYVTGFLNAFSEYSAKYFGGNTGFFIYLLYRLFFKGQIWNSLANYVLLFIFLPVFNRVFRPKAD